MSFLTPSESHSRLEGDASVYSDSSIQREPQAVFESSNQAEHTRPDDTEYMDASQWSGLAYLRRLSETLNRRHGVKGAGENLDEAIRVRRIVVVSLISLNSDELASDMDALSELLETRFLKGHAIQDIDEALLWRRKLVDLSLPESSEFWYSDANNLSRALLDRYRTSKVPQDLEAAIKWAFKALQAISTDEEDYNIISYQLAVTHQAKWELAEDPRILDEEIKWYKESIRSLESTSPYIRHRQNLLGAALCIRADISRSAVDMEESLKYLIKIRDSCIPGSEEYIRSLNNLANAYETAADIDGLDWEDSINHALQAARSAVDEAPSAYPRLDTCLYNLSNIKEVQYRKTGLTDALHESVLVAKRCVEKTPPNSPRMQRNIANLGILLGRLYDETADEDDFNEAVRLLRQALSLVSHNSPTRPRCLNQLGLTYLNGFQIAGDPQYLDDAKECLESAAACSSEQSPITAGILIHLFDALSMRHTGTQSSEDIQKAIEVARKASRNPAAAPSVKLRAAFSAGTLISTSDKTAQGLSEAAQLLEQAVQLLPLLAPTHLARLEQQGRLKSFNASRMTSDAAALALETELSAEKSLSLFETGRGVTLGNSLGSRFEVSRLRDAHPDLAGDIERYRAIIDESQALMEASLPESGSALHTGDGDIPPPHRHQLRMAQAVDNLNKTYDKIRLQERFKSFMLPFTLHGCVTRQGEYIIAVNLSSRRCDAIVVTRERLSSVNLPLLSLPELEMKDRTFRNAIMNRTKNPELSKRVLLDTLRWLWQACGEPLMEYLGLRKFTEHKKPRVWWIAGGLLGRLPLHACGDYTMPVDLDNPVAHTMYDCVVSAYAPTIRVLKYAQEGEMRQLNENQKASTLIVAVPHSEGATSLLHAEGEAVEIQGLVQPTTLLINPSFSDVLLALSHCTAAHFACHGITNEKDPTKSYLRLRDYDKQPLSVDVLMKTNIHNCEFVYLSACDTANSADEKLADESLHLVSGFLLSGCPRVIGTLWEIPDDQAREVAKAFYSHLPRHEDGTVDFSQAAEALHSVVNMLRKRPQFTEDPLLWAAYIYAGA